MPITFDCIVLGVGGFGSGVLYHLVRRGARVLGIERFDVAHNRGSSHGETRIIRKAYFEHPDYVPLLVRAYELWRELESETGQTLCDLGGLMLTGPPDGEAIAGAKLAARLHGILVEEVDGAEARVRFPGFRIPEGFAIVFEPEAGWLYVEECVRAHVERAVTGRAVLATGETVVQWTPEGRTVRVRTDRNEYEAACLVVTAGAWARDVLAERRLPLEVVRKPVFWHLAPSRDYDAATGAPAFYYETASGAFYGFPCLDGRAVKVAEHTGGQPVGDPLALDGNLHEEDWRAVSEFLRQSLPGVHPEPVRHSVCMYTLTPDRHFIVDRHPVHENVAIGAGFSGHGFKFTTVLGAALADLALEGRTNLPVGFLGLDRMFPTSRSL